MSNARQRLEAIYRDAIEAVQPDRALRAALDGRAVEVHGTTHLIALGKAARTMLTAAHAWCVAQRVTAVRGICVSHEAHAAVPVGIIAVQGDHPIAGNASRDAAQQLDAYIAAEVRSGDQVLVLLSGGTSALIGAPRDAVDAAIYQACCAALLRSGLDIHAHNEIRRQLSRWGDGRLGAALHAQGARVEVFAVSDVPGDRIEDIGSAPCVHVPVSPGAIEAMLDASRLVASDRMLVLDAVRSAASAAAIPCPDMPHHIVSSNRMARAAVAAAAQTAGFDVIDGDASLSGDAEACGRAIADHLVRGAQRVAIPALLCWGGEPVVALPSHAPAGGRMQALALAAAQVLHASAAHAHGITLLAAGTDGRDGPTDAAGAVIDRATWSAIAMAGGDADALRASYHSHQALRLAGALMPAFVSGTNVNDLVIGVIDRRS